MGRCRGRDFWGWGVMHVGSLFSGIGGLDLGLAWAGMTTVWAVERDRLRRKWLRKNFPEVRIHADIQALDGNGFAGLDTVDLVCGGPPCQPASLAGERRGPRDDRWLWPQAVRCMAALRPAWGLFENPVGFVTLGLDGVLSDLEGFGYDVWPIIIPACAVNAPHRRDRLFVLAHAQEQPQRPGLCQGGAESIRRGRFGDSGGTGDVADTVGGRRDGGKDHERDGQARGGRSSIDDKITVGDSGVPGLPLPELCGEPGKAECDMLPWAAAPERSGASVRPWDDASWMFGRDGKSRRVPSLESGIRPLAHGVPGRVAHIAGYGDAVVPQVAYEIGLAISMAEAMRASP